MIEKRKKSLFSFLDEQSNLQSGSNGVFLKNIKKYLGNSEALGKFNRMKETKFTIKHYAGDVEYDTSEFREKNKDSIDQDFYELLNFSKKA